MLCTPIAWSTTLVLRAATILRDDYDWATEFKISFGVVGCPAPCSVIKHDFAAHLVTSDYAELVKLWQSA
jgi:hypothetical protein